MTLGRTYTYGYSGTNQLLSSYTAPGASRAVQYTYTGNLLTGIDIPMDADSTSQTRITYYPDGNAHAGKVRYVDRYFINATSASDSARTEYVYTTDAGQPATQVKDPRGNVTTYVLDYNYRVIMSRVMILGRGSFLAL